MCIVNGRCTPEYDDFTSVSVKGLTVIDFWITPYENLSDWKMLRVIPISTFVQNMNMQVAGRLSDHSLLLLEVQVNPDNQPSPSHPNNVSYQNVAPPQHYNNTNSTKPVKYRIHEIPPTFMSSLDTLRKCEDLIDDLLLLQQQQRQVDDWYQRFIGVLHDEMNHFFRHLDDTPNARKNAQKMSKPWWEDSLSILNKDVHRKEKAWRD